MPDAGVNVMWSQASSADGQQQQQASLSRLYRFGASGAFDVSVLPHAGARLQPAQPVYQHMALVLGLLDAIRDILAQVPTEGR